MQPFLNKVSYPFFYGFSLFIYVLVNLKSEFASIQALLCNSTLNQRSIEKLIYRLKFSV